MCFLRPHPHDCHHYQYTYTSEARGEALFFPHTPAHISDSASFLAVSVQNWIFKQVGTPAAFKMQNHNS
jgi:hypothetical protein